MTFFTDVVVPGPWWNALTYTSESFLPTGARVKVPLGRGRRVGFVTKSLAEEAVSTQPPGRLRGVEELVDDGVALGSNLWDLAHWVGRTFLCGTGEALQLIAPKPLLQGAEIPASALREDERTAGVFQELNCYHPLDSERERIYRERFESSARFLILFPEAEAAKRFFSRLPAPLRDEALLWPSTGGKKLWESWIKARSGDVRIVVGPPGAVFAPLDFDEVVVEDEANPAYTLVRPPRVSARSLAGRRALTGKAVLFFGGRMPSAKTFLRARPEPPLLPARRNFVFADMTMLKKTDVRGVEGELPITRSLLDRTKAALYGGRSVLWIMDRKGVSAEVFCSDCGASIHCSRCGLLMRSEGNGDRLRCVKCGNKENLPAACPSCRGVLLMGKRPGLEALLPAAMRYIRGYPVFLDQPQKTPALILGTRKTLSLCDSLDIGLVGWLDLDAETRKIDYNARFQTFSMVWESYWRGLAPEGSERLVLIQSRRRSDAWQSLWLGWSRFWKDELAERKTLDLPPHALLVQMDLPKAEDKNAFIRSLEKAGLVVMDAGDDEAPLWATVQSTDVLRAALAPRFGIAQSRAGFPVVTVWSE